MALNKQTLSGAIQSANTGLDAIKRAPIVDRDTGIKCLRIQDISQKKKYLNWGFTEVRADNYDKFKLQKDDILIARTGASIGVNRFISENIRAVYNNGLIRIRANKANYYPKFIYYLIQSDSFKEHINSIAFSTSAQPNMKIKDLLRFEFTNLRLPEQKAIAHILGSLDDKIELNRRMNATLEGMAQALFKSWFVDFDPVLDNILAKNMAKCPSPNLSQRERDKSASPSGRSGDEGSIFDGIPEELAERAAVRRQALSDGTANREAAKQFPAAFQLTEELGWIPEGWEVSTIGDEVETVGGGTPSTKNRNFWEDGEYPWVTPKDFSSLQDKVLLSSSRYLTSEGLKKVSSGLLPKGTVLMSSRAPVGYLAITQIETAINQGFIAMKCNGRLPPEYILQWVTSIMDDIKQASSGSTFAEISKKVFRPFKVLVPTLDTIEAYTDVVAPTYARITDNVVGNETLSLLRDVLLPKLISGELRLNA